MSYPLFDSGFTLWAADLEAQLMERHGVTCRTLGIAAHTLQECYYRGGSVTDALSLISRRHHLG